MAEQRLVGTAIMKVGLNIKSKGRNRVLTIWPARGVDCDEFLLGVPHILNQVSNLDEVFFLFDTSTEVDGFVNDKLCEITSRKKRQAIAGPTTWQNVSEILMRLMNSGLRGVDAFSPRTPAYVPKASVISSISSGGYHWFKHALRRLNWFCIFWLEKEDQFEMGLWSKGGSDDVCERLFRQLTGGDDPIIRARVNRERRRRRRLHSLGLLGLAVSCVALMILLWSPRSLSTRIIAWVLLAGPPIPSLALLSRGSESFEGEVQLPEKEKRQETGGSY